MTGGDRQWTAPFFHAFIQSTLIGGELHVATSELDPEDIIGVALWCVWFTLREIRLSERMNISLCVYQQVWSVNLRYRRFVHSTQNILGSARNSETLATHN